MFKPHLVDYYKAEVSDTEITYSHLTATFSGFVQPAKFSVIQNYAVKEIYVSISVFTEDSIASEIMVNDKLSFLEQEYRVAAVPVNLSFLDRVWRIDCEVM